MRKRSVPNASVTGDALERHAGSACAEVLEPLGRERRGDFTPHHLQSNAIYDDLRNLVQLSSAAIALISLSSPLPTVLAAEEFTRRLLDIPIRCLESNPPFRELACPLPYTPESARYLKELLHNVGGFDKVFSQWHRRGFDRNGIEVEVVNASGQPAHLHVALYGTFTDVGLSRIWVVLRDSSPLNRAIAAAARAEYHYRTLIDQPGLSLFRLDPDGTIEYASSEARTLFGAAAPCGLPLYKNLHRFVHPEDIPPLIQTLTKRSAQPKYRREPLRCTARILLPGGEYAPARWTLLNHSNLTNDIEHIDVLISLPGSYNQQADPAARGALHDLNNHLLIAHANAELSLRTISPSSAGVSTLRSTLLAIDQCSQITSAQLGPQGLLSPSPTRLTVASMLEAVADECRAIIPADITVDVIVPPSAIEVWADEQHLQQILVNLIMNAKDALNGRGTITVSATTRGNVDASAQRVRGREVCISVSDDGPGIPQDLAKGLFTQQATTKQRKDGHGLGLLMVKKLCDINKGEILVTTSTGKGSTFTLILPSAEASTSTNTYDAPPSSRGSPQSLAPLSVLIADDEAPIRDVLLTALTMKGYQAIGVSDSRSLRHELSNNSNRYDLAVVDGGLTPDLRRGALEVIREHRQDLPIIVISGDHSLEQRCTSADLSIRFLPKPFALESLYSLISESTTDAGKDEQE